MKASDLMTSMNRAADEVVKQLMEYVREKGHKPTPGDIKEFGLDLDGAEATHVLSFNERAGCEVIKMKSLVNPEISMSDIDDNVYDLLEDEFTHRSIRCIYIRKENDGSEHLMCYHYVNPGIIYTDNPDDASDWHDRVASLGWVTIERIIRYINDNPTCLIPKEMMQ